MWCTSGIDELYRDPDTIKRRLKAQQQRIRESNRTLFEEKDALERDIARLNNELEDWITDKRRNKGQRRAEEIFDRHIAAAERGIDEAEERLRTVQRQLDNSSMSDEHVESIVEQARAYRAQGEEPWSGMIKDDTPLIGLFPPRWNESDPYAHIRKEERILFPLIQQHCTEEMLQKIQPLLA